jgi:hypothetical protein
LSFANTYIKSLSVDYAAAAARAERSLYYCNYVKDEKVNFAPAAAGAPLLRDETLINV